MSIAYMKTPRSAGVPQSADWVSGGGEMGRLIRSFDWANTPLGSLESWPQSLRSATSILLPSKAQIVIFWGPDLITLYNDAYAPVFGQKHPHVLGLPASEAWSELWDDLKNLFEGVLRTGEAFWASDRYFYMERYGFPEETFFDVSYDPIRDETGNVGGLFCIVTETTSRVVGERRLRTLRDLSLFSAAETKSVEDTCRGVADLLSSNRHDVPFALVYLLDETGTVAHLRGSSGVEAGTAAAPLSIPVSPGGEDGWPVNEVIEANRAVEVTDVIQRCGELTGGPWPEPTHTAMVMPIAASGQERATGFLVAGVSPRRPLDDQYRGFFQLLATHIATRVADARAYEAERLRAEALAELDRAKTIFFSNVSHEFRTPLTLIVGPVADLLNEVDGSLTAPQRERLDIAHRNALRLQKLVNTLLDFSRIEAGRVRAAYEPTNLARLTADLASNFRSACERAGLELIVDCPDLEEPAYIDPDMWEKIVLNLISNAFKFTLSGRIEVRLKQTENHFELVVSDTGVGIPAAEMPKLFERFHRVTISRGRTQEGSGIGLALVRELVKLHGGSITVKSELGRGSVFTLTLPRGKDHLPMDHVSVARTLSLTALGAAPFVGEALRWLPDGARKDSSDVFIDSGMGSVTKGPRVNERPARILLADDNADMRDYLRRLLENQYEVRAVPDGQSAWDAIQREIPDLILSDVMMPFIDGFKLVRMIRADSRTREVPVILLSARAGEESRIEGLEAAADDYLTKPFSARELLATVNAHLKMIEMRRERLHLIEELRLQDSRKDEFIATLAHELRNPLAPIRNGLKLIRMGRNDSDTLDKATTIMERQVQQMVRLVDDLLDVARISRNKLELRKEPVQLDAVVRSAIETSRPLIESAGHDLNVSLPSQTVMLDADPVRLAQAFSNLLNNAAKYSERGGRISLTAEQRDGNLFIKVKDSGIGIQPDKLAYVFEMFVQAGGTELSQGGLGIGLTLVRRLIEMHGGRVQAHSDGPGKGSEFVVRLPLTLSGTIAHQSGEVQAGASSAIRRRVVVVDDNQDAAESMALMLEFAGHEVAMAHDGLKAIEVMAQFRPDIAFLDLGMPRLDGYDAARRIRQEAWGKDVLLVAVTGWGQGEDKRRTKEAGFNLHLVKPIDFGALEQLLTKL